MENRSIDEKVSLYSRRLFSFLINLVVIAISVTSVWELEKQKDEFFSKFIQKTD